MLLECSLRSSLQPAVRVSLTTHISVYRARRMKPHEARRAHVPNGLSIRMSVRNRQGTIQRGLSAMEACFIPCRSMSLHQRSYEYHGNFTDCCLFDGHCEGIYGVESIHKDVAI